MNLVVVLLVRWRHPLGPLHYRGRCVASAASQLIHPHLPSFDPSTIVPKHQHGRLAAPQRLDLLLAPRDPGSIKVEGNAIAAFQWCRPCLKLIQITRHAKLGPAVAAIQKVGAEVGGDCVERHHNYTHLHNCQSREVNRGRKSGEFIRPSNRGVYCSQQ